MCLVIGKNVGTKEAKRKQEKKIIPFIKNYLFSLDKVEFNSLL